MQTSSAATSLPALSTSASCLRGRPGANIRRQYAGSTCVLRQRLRGLAFTACVDITRLSARCETSYATEQEIVNAKLASVCGYFTYSQRMTAIFRVQDFFFPVNKSLVCGLQDAATNRSPWILPTLSTRNKSL